LKELPNKRVMKECEKKKKKNPILVACRKDAL
jgi:hypothetical protein